MVKSPVRVGRTRCQSEGGERSRVRLPVVMTALFLSTLLSAPGCGSSVTTDECDGDCPANEDEHELNGAADLNGCSGAVFRFAGQPLSDRALGLTNGHCVDLLEPEGAITMQEADMRLRLFDRDGQRTDWFEVETVLYATMEQTDLAVLRLGMTFEQVEEMGVKVRVLSAERPSAGDSVRVVAGGVRWTSECTVDRIFPEVREGDYVFEDSISLSDECETFPGTSGAPLINTETDLIVGVNNTGVLEDWGPCELDQPCAVDEDGEIHFWVGASFGQQTADLYSCVDEDFEIDVLRAGCRLPR